MQELTSQTLSTSKTEITNFKTDLDYISNEMEILGRSVDEEKLKIIGQRNLFVGEEDNINREKVTLDDAIREKQRELDRFQVQLESLQAIATDQIEYIDVFRRIP